ncbi:DUF5320 family protein [bacterium]|nr:DUF5320 family protein [bacterium]
MPGFDGKGPVGHGPRTGRGRGICGIGIRSFTGKRSRTVGLLTFVVPAVAAVINDARKPYGITRRLYRAIKGRFAGSADKGAVTGSSVNYIEDKHEK